MYCIFTLDPLALGLARLKAKEAVLEYPSNYLLISYSNVKISK